MLFSSSLFGVSQRGRWSRPPACRREGDGAGALLDLRLQGWQPKVPYQFVDAGCVPVTKENVDTFQTGIEAMTKTIMGEIKTKYLEAPGVGDALRVR